MAQLCRDIYSQPRHILTIRKRLLNSNISPIPAHNMVNFGQLTAEICWRVWGTPANMNGFRVLAALLHRRRLTEVNQTLHDIWPSPVLIHYIYILRGSCLITEFCHIQNPICVQVLCSPILLALLHGTRAVGVSETLRRRTRNGITELLQRAPPIFGWAAITLGIGPHSSFSSDAGTSETTTTTTWCVIITGTLTFMGQNLVNMRFICTKISFPSQVMTNAA